MTILMNNTTDEVTPVGAAPVSERPPRDWTFVNWALALLTAAGAALVMKFALAAVASTTWCSRIACHGLGPREPLFHVLYFTAPTVGVLILAVSLFTATYRSGMIVPICGAALLLADWTALGIMF